jgi:prevent-host-death family protein
MKTTPISVTEAARNFADCVNRVRYQNMTFVLLKNGEPVARLVPDGEKVCRAHDLAKIVRKADLTVEEFKAWNRYLRAARKILKPPTNRWG